MNALSKDLSNVKAVQALERAHDHLVHHVAEYVRTAEARLEQKKSGE